MELGNTRFVFQVNEIEQNISEREQEIAKLQKQHNIPAEWFDGEFDSETHNFKMDAVKEYQHCPLSTRNSTISQCYRHQTTPSGYQADLYQ